MPLLKSTSHTRQPSRWLTPAIGFAALAAGAWVYLDFRAWQRLGAGGIAGDFSGWLKTTRLRMQTGSPFDLSLLHPLADDPANPTFLDNLPLRTPPRPSVAPHPVPHRQLTQRIDPALFSPLQSVFDAAVAQHAAVVTYAMSHFERHTQAITSKLSAALDPIAGASHGEIGHIHALDGSMHMILSPADAVRAIENGWGELHGLAGRAMGLPPNYVMIYAPRVLEDTIAIRRLIHAAIAYMAREVQPASVPPRSRLTTLQALPHTPQ